MITLKSPRELDTMRRAGKIVHDTLAHMAEILKPGMTTEDLDAEAERFIRSHAGAVPSFKGLYGTQENTDKGTVTVDENYIRESLIDPQAKITAGFDGVMPSFKGQLTDKEITGIIEYLKTLSQ